MDPVRQRLEQLIAERGDDCAALSRLLKRNAAYVQQFLKRGTPRKLDEDESELGAPPPAVPASVSSAVTMIPRLQLGASAGPGALASGEESGGRFGFDPRWLRRLGAHPESLSIIQVTGDSMQPTLGDGDDIMVDGSDAADRLRDGIYVIRVDDALMVKRLAVGPGANGLSIISDNSAYPPWNGDRVDIVGRVVWAGRRVR
jgi:phage repressor protein C with HTH and peptisase S24 domain